MRILVLAEWLAPYRVDLFNLLAKEAEVVVLYFKGLPAERNSDWHADINDWGTYHFLKSKHIKYLGGYCPNMQKYIKNHAKDFDIIYLEDYGSLNQALNIITLSKFKIPYFVNVDGAIVRENEPKLLTKLKRSLLSHDCHYLCGSSVSNKYLEHYGVKSERIINHRFTSLFAKDIPADGPTLDEKKSLRHELGMSERHIILSVGRFTYKAGYGKGYDAILRAAARMGNDYGFYIVGDEPTAEFVEMRERLGADNVHFVGFKQKEELKKYYKAADIFTLMTVYDVWGLVVNEAMACSLPVITTDMCVAGLQLIRDGYNGYIVKVGDDHDLERRVIESCADPKHLAEMSANALETIRPYTIENVAREHLDVFKRFLN